MTTIKLTRGQSCMVNDDDVELLSRLKWHAHKSRGGSWYAISKIRGKAIKMHRFLLNPPEEVSIDHIDGNGLNNQRQNLRICIHRENCRNQKRRLNNKSGFKGVYFHKKTKRWAATICAGKVMHLGLFDCALEAAKKYDQVAERVHGPFALTNRKLGLLH